MQKFKYFFSCAVALAIAGFFSSCGDNDEPLPTLIPAMVTVAVSDQIQDLPGDATSKDITVEANRELKVTVPAEATWLTATVKSADLTAGTAVLTIAVTDNETAFKGRSATIQIECVASRTDDNVSGTSAKGTISVTQSLKGLAVADLFDLKLNADGTAEDASGTFKWGDKVAYFTNTDPTVTMSGGPVKPTVAVNPQYGRLEATFSGIQSADYTNTHNNQASILSTALGWNTQYGTSLYEEYNFEKKNQEANPDSKKYESWNGTAPELRQQGNTKLCFFKMHYGGKMYDGAGRIEKVNTALQTAYSYEVLVRWPYDIGEVVATGADGTELVYDTGSHGYVFGNSVPRDDRGGAAIRGRNGKLCFTFATNWGSEGRAHLDMAHTEESSGFVVAAGNHPDAANGVDIKKDVVYHLVATYSKAEGKVAFYVDGKLLVSTTDARLKTNPPSFPTQYYAHEGGPAPDNFPVGNVHVPNVEYFVIPGGSNANMPTNGGDIVGHNIRFMVARVYGKALTPEEVAASYNYLKPE